VAEYYKRYSAIFFDYIYKYVGGFIMLYTTFTVKDRDYKARLNVKACVELEKKLGSNPLNIFIKMTEGDTITLPPVGELMLILHQSLQAYEHGITMDKVYELYDDFISEGHNQMDLITIIVDIFKVSGLIPEEVEEEKNA
jgi:hypothetical protein